MKAEKEIDCFNTRNLVCPYCGEENVNSWEIGESGEIQCGSCEKNFMYDTEVRRYFTSRKADCLNGYPHNWKQVRGQTDYPNARRCKDCGFYEWKPKCLEVRE